MENEKASPESKTEYQQSKDEVMVENPTLLDTRGRVYRASTSFELIGRVFWP